jgi:DNA polymerase-3 subunit gamma/tau
MTNTREGATVAARAAADGYTVVARRYRPQSFEEVIGQDHVVEALRNAIQLKRVAHAYLFCGTRGVGKTSLARIFAKCLNCVRGPTIHPCQECDICQAITSGQDVDVIEIDGASNNGVEAVRELRQNAGLRPSRSRYKIYYIDEVHMLSTAAFNALLKTLEEPPEHVKFLFATTEAHKVPITVLSRCQKFELAPIGPDAISGSLAAICQREGVEADPDALRTIARRAAGSMRDAQSLLEQLLSSGDRRVTGEDVHRILGMAADERVLDLLDALAARDAATTLTVLDRAVGAGVQPSDMLGGAIDFLRDTLVLSVGATEVEPLAASPAQRPRLEALAGRWSVDGLLAAMQVLDQARGRLRGSPHGRLIVELALCRVARLESFAELGELIARLSALESGTQAPRAPAPEKKKPEPAVRPPEVAPVTPSRPTQVPPSRPTADGVPGPLRLDAVEAIWSLLPQHLDGKQAGEAKWLRPLGVSGPDQLAVGAEPGYNWVADRFDVPEARTRLESALKTLLGRPLTLRIERPQSGPVVAAAIRPEETLEDPFVQRVVELFEARPVRVEPEEGPGA